MTARAMLVVAASLLIGATTTVLVAWSCAAWSSARSDREDTRASREALTRDLAPGAHARSEGTLDERGFGYSESTPITVLAQPDPMGSGWVYYELASEVETTISAGWPCIALSTTRPLRGTRASRPMPTWVPGARPSRVVPTRPQWTGFTANTVLFGTAAWLLLTGPGVVRRRARVARGRCGACGYPRSDAEVCSECGRPGTTQASLSRHQRQVRPH